jgi:hypothetical protein
MTASGTFSVEGVNSTTCKEPPSCRSYPPFVPFVETVGLSSTPSLRLRPRLCVTRSSAQLSRRPALPRASESLTPFAPSWPSAAPVWAQGASSPGHSAHLALPRPGPRRGDRDSWGRSSASAFGRRRNRCVTHAVVWRDAGRRADTGRSHREVDHDSTLPRCIRSSHLVSGGVERFFCHVSSPWLAEQRLLFCAPVLVSTQVICKITITRMMTINTPMIVPMIPRFMLVSSGLVAITPRLCDDLER